ncbi:hypothetical protein LYSHEL_30950 [Lysobacter helvus]|uniref:Outer membrane protein assembly factor BamE domain-containing protein n=2 Tax=Lysobacteraceae TaxID=32033 RepID=A0ABN6FWI3_9GAMM|nr:hypothetical protein LYSCAS_30920 [Lysobacter caseinilyticus]BCT97224.1 hypothetical protein LYSHEL_30950 [Lysobacter helvus]
MRLRWRNARVVSCGLVAIALLAVGAWWHLRERATAFDHAAWSTGDSAGATVRLRMADGLVASHALQGKSRSEVRAMLGPPSTGGYFRGQGDAYWLGPERGYVSIDSEWLVVHFDANDHVDAATIRRD